MTSPEEAQPGPDAAPPRKYARHRVGVGPPEYYDVMGATQFALLYALGLRENDTLADVGCGSLRAGKYLVQFLAPGRYHGIEPNETLLRDGIEEHLGTELVARKRPAFEVADDFPLERFGVQFDVVLAQSIFSHTFVDLTRLGFEKISGALAPNGVFVGTFVERVPGLPPGIRGARPNEGSGWLPFGGIPYTWREMSSLLREAGMEGRVIRWWHHRQTWFVAARPSGQDAMKARVRRLGHRVRGAPRLLRVAPGITARLGLGNTLKP